MLLNINDVLVVTDPETGEIVRAANRKEVEGLRGICRDAKGRIVHSAEALEARKEHFLTKRAQFIERIVACENEVKAIDAAHEFDDAGEKVRLQSKVHELNGALSAEQAKVKELTQLLKQLQESSELLQKRAADKIAGLMKQLEVVAPMAEKPPKIEIVEKVVEVTKPCACWWCKFVGWFN